MNILHITTYLQGGAGKVIRDLAIEQSKKNKVIVITSKTDYDGYCNYNNYIDELESEGIEVILEDSTFKRDLYLNMRVANLLRNKIIENKIDIIHAHASIPALIATISTSNLDRRIPIVQTMHGWGTNKREEHEYVDVSTMNIIDKVITVSLADKLLLSKKGVENSKIDCIYNGIDTYSKTSGEDKDLINIIQNLRDDGFTIIGCIGTVCERKNQKLLINAINKADDKFALIIIGEIADKIFDEIEIPKKDRVVITGLKPNAEQYLKYFDFLCLPSLSEGLPITIIEAFRKKIPVICSDIDPFKELIMDKENGYIFKSNDLDSLINTIKFAGINNNLNIVKEAYNVFENKFKLESMTKNYYSCYLNLID